MRYAMMTVGLLVVLAACSSSGSNTPADPLAGRDATTLTDDGSGLADTMWGWRLEGSNHYRAVEQSRTETFIGGIKVSEEEDDPEVSWRRVDFSQGIGGPVDDQAQGVLETDWELAEDGVGGWETVGVADLSFMTLGDNDIIYRYSPLTGEQWVAFMPATVAQGQRWRIEEDWLGAGYAVTTSDFTVESINATSPASADTAPASHDGCIRVRIDIDGESDMDAGDWECDEGVTWDGTGSISISGTMRVYIKPGLGMVHIDSDLSLSALFENIDFGLGATTMRVVNRVDAIERYADALPLVMSAMSGDG